MNQQEFRKVLEKHHLSFSIEEMKISLLWTPYDISKKPELPDKPTLAAEVEFDQQLVPKSSVVCDKDLAEEMIIKLTKFTETIALILLARTQKMVNDKGEPIRVGLYDKKSEFYDKVLKVYDDICSKY